MVFHNYAVNIRYLVKHQIFDIDVAGKRYKRTGLSTLIRFLERDKQETFPQITDFSVVPALKTVIYRNASIAYFKDFRDIDCYSRLTSDIRITWDIESPK